LLYEKDKCIFNLECVKLLEKLITFGLYKDYQEVNELIDPLTNLLDSSLDFHTKTEYSNYKKEIGLIPSAPQTSSEQNENSMSPSKLSPIRLGRSESEEKISRVSTRLL
jgi:hypothetical protein